MFSKSFVTFVGLALALSETALGRERWLERDGRAVFLHPRRFGQEHPPQIDELSSACAGQICGVLAGSFISTLLAAAPECSQQDACDDIIDAAKNQTDASITANMISLAVQLRQVEKNTPPDFSVQPNILRNSVFCQTAPRNSELNGLVQAQDPSNDPDVFFDPATKASVQKGAQANTFPFGTSGSSSASSTAAASEAASTTSAADLAVDTSTCPAPVTVTVTAAAAETTAASSAVTASVAASTTAAASSSGNTVGDADFGSCSIPKIIFATGFDNRKETSFEPADETSYPHGSAQNIDIITQFVCDELVNSCKANAAAKTLCANAKAAADTGAAKTGIQADLFNAEFGITTDFAAVASVDDQGNVIAGTGSSSASTAAAASNVAAATSAVSTAASASSTAASTSSSSASSSASLGDADFGSCSTPEIIFGVGFDNRRETAFEPKDLTSYNHGSADNIAVITQFMCNQLTNTCGANQAAKDLCATAEAGTGATKTGKDADQFNAFFGITTTFADDEVVDDTGKVTQAGASASSAASSSSSSSEASSASTTTSAAAIAATSASAAAVAGNLQTFTAALGGVSPPAVTASGSQFQVAGNSAFNSLSSALERSCDVQNNQCANAANASGNKNGLTVAACNAQQAQCNASHS